MIILSFLFQLFGATMLLLFTVRMVRTGIERALGPSFRGLLTASRRPVNLAPVRVGLTWGRVHALKSDSDLSVVDIRPTKPGNRSSWTFENPKTSADRSTGQTDQTDREGFDSHVQQCPICCKVTHAAIQLGQHMHASVTRLRRQAIRTRAGEAVKKQIPPLTINTAHSEYMLNKLPIIHKAIKCLFHKR